MKKITSLAVIVMLIGIFLMAGMAMAYENEAVESDQTVYTGPSAGAVVGDVLARPFLVTGALISTAFGIATMPGVFLCGIGEQWARISVEAPWRFAVGRPLGEFNTYRDSRPITVVTR